MSTEKQVRWFTDIAERCRLIEEAVAATSEDELRANRALRQSIFYDFIVIGEAATRLREPSERLVPNGDWAKARSFGNFLKHDYERVDLSIVLQIVRSGQLAQLRRDSELAIQKLVHKRS